MEEKKNDVGLRGDFFSRFRYTLPVRLFTFSSAAVRHSERHPLKRTIHDVLLHFSKVPHNKERHVVDKHPSHQEFCILLRFGQIRSNVHYVHVLLQISRCCRRSNQSQHTSRKSKKLGWAGSETSPPIAGIPSF